ncbi:hypothetical protein MCEMSHM24_02684 [Comamonadaceae bacterium]
MRYIQHPTNNHVLGAPGGWDQKAIECGALPVTKTELEGGHPVMVSFWKPDAADLETLAKGGSVALWVYGNTHPVVAVSTEK